jgi:hypothetical protein
MLELDKPRPNILERGLRKVLLQGEDLWGRIQFSLGRNIVPLYPCSDLRACVEKILATEGTENTENQHNSFLNKELKQGEKIF